jgi:hypothetical protein
VGASRGTHAVHAVAEKRVGIQPLLVRSGFAVGGESDLSCLLTPQVEHLYRVEQHVQGRKVKLPLAL